MIQAADLSYELSISGQASLLNVFLICFQHISKTLLNSISFGYKIHMTSDDFHIYLKPRSYPVLPILGLLS